MAQARKAPRLWLRKARVGRVATWFILDNGRQISTGCCEVERARAENELLKYMEERKLFSQQKLYLYFITADANDFPVKIGISQNIKPRFSALQNALPYAIKPIAIIEIDDFNIEWRIHEKFANIRLKGEWFKRTDDLLLYIKYLTQPVLTSIEIGPMKQPLEPGISANFCAP